ncbi:MAG: hypothetical protein LBL80_02825 [Ruminococcus sp.]|jgi:hypothetical protein|nr:hypothetical protein [Ruminococcus sp.]
MANEERKVTDEEANKVTGGIDSSLNYEDIQKMLEEAMKVQSETIQEMYKKY